MFEVGVKVVEVGQVVVETKPGRSLKMESSLRSSLTVMLKGVPELATINGLRRKSKGRPNDPPRKTRLRISNEARP
jgi:hypothetical protein